MEETKYETIEGKVQKKEKREKGPIGEFIVNDIKFTCWSETFWNKFDEDDMVFISYVTKDNEYNGKKYTNRNISFMRFLDEPKPDFSRPLKEVLANEGVDVSKLTGPKHILQSDNLKFKLGGINYRVKSVELELIEN